MSERRGKIEGVLAEFASAGDLLEAARKVREAGYRRFDCHSPFPIHGMDKAMGLKRSPVGYIAGICGFLGGSFGLWLQWWTSTVDYRLVISGKPFFSYQAYVPVTFGMTVLLAAFGALFGFLFMSGLPRPHHPVFYSDRFSGFSTDKFFVSIEARDRKFNESETVAFLRSIGAVEVEVLRAE